MAKRKFELDIGAAKTKMQTLMTDAICDEYAEAPRSAVRIFCNRYINSHHKEMERQTRLSAETLDLARDHLRNSKDCVKDVRSNRWEVPDNWRVYISFISVEEAVKAHATLHGESFRSHEHIDRLIATMRNGISRQRIRALNDLSNSCGADLDIDSRFEVLIEEIDRIRKSRDRFASASRGEILSALQSLEDVRRSHSDQVRNSPLFKAMDAKLPAIGREIFPRNPEWARFLVQQVRAAIWTERVEWPYQMDLLLLGVLLEPHKNLTRYVNGRVGSIRPERYRSRNPMGIVTALGEVLDLIASVHKTLDLRMRNIREAKIIEIRGD